MCSTYRNANCVIAIVNEMSFICYLYSHNKLYDYYTPSHSLAPHFLVWKDTPVHLLPPFRGFGLLHFLGRELRPQLVEQLDQGPQADQPPFTWRQWVNKVTMLIHMFKQGFHICYMSYVVCKCKCIWRMWWLFTVWTGNSTLSSHSHQSL